TSNALLLDNNANNLIYFNHGTANFNGTVSGAITVRAWDGTDGATSGTLNTTTTVTGGTSPSAYSADTSVSLAISAVNDAPTGMGNTTIPAVLEDTADPAGVAISALTSLSFSDVDAGSGLGGIAVVGNTANAGTEGVWEYSSDGTNWQAIGTVADGATARALASTTKLRFVPVANFNGTPTGLTVRALDDTYVAGFTTWDGTTETVVNVDTTTPGGATAIASATNTIGTSITAVNDAPTTTGAGVTLTNVVEDNVTSVGDAVSSLVSNISDVDGGAVKGIAIYATDTANGAWEYTINDGGLWTSVGVVSGTSALLLRGDDANTKLRFVPATNYNGTATVSFYAWDQTTNTSAANGTKVDVSTRGTTTEFSTTSENATVTVTPVNDAPTQSATGNT
ncbi:MAG: hypothetical protein CO017_01675, partial [Zetaproteobacteria bacterium CG_4_8_14_3_um_filter_59_5]